MPRLVATRPNQVWTWDVTDLRGPMKGERYKLYVVLDLFRRYVVAWMLAWQESARLARRLIRWAFAHEGIAWLTSATVHHGHAADRLVQRQRVMDLAYQQTPERFVNGPPLVRQLPQDVWINRLVDQTAVTG